MPQSQISRPLLALFTVVIGLNMTGVMAQEKTSFPDAKRIVSVGGTVTEILFALNAHERIIAVDATSIHPSQAREKADVGYMRALSPEGIIGQNPDLILLQEGSGPQDAISVLRASGLPVVTIASKPNAESVSQKIRDVGAAVGLDAQASAIADRVGTQLQAAIAENANRTAAKKRVLFVLSLANGRVMVGGKDTEPAELIRMAGGINAAEQVSGYKPMTDEAIIAAKPDFVLVMETGNHRFTLEQVFDLPAFKSTPAGETRALLGMDGLLLTGFGPRTPDAVRLLAAKLYGGSQ